MASKINESTAIRANGSDGDGNDSNDNNDTKHQHVVKKSAEPGVINDAMLKNLLHAHGPRGEAARLCREIAIDYSTITELCLEYQNILKIDHIWMCLGLQKLSLKANKLTKIENLDNLNELRELDLSFNFIKTIENVAPLCRLEYLTLFQNHIRKIENLLELEHLVRLNLGNNFIETVDGIESLRYKKQLFSLNLDGNPICDKLPDNIDFRLYIAAYLPNLTYYGYRVITNDERDEGRKIYKNKLRMLEETESELSIEIHEQSLEAEQQRLSSVSFVEDLDKHQLFESLFANDCDNNVSNPDASIDGADQSSHIDACRAQIYGATQEMHAYGIRCHNQRANEIKQFDEALANSCDEVQTISIELINKFFDQTAEFVMNLKQSIKSMCKSTDDNCIINRQPIDTLTEHFGLAVDSCWYTLIELETSLHERILGSMNRFNGTMRTIIENFNDKSNETFSRIRSICEAHFPSNIDIRDETMQPRHITIINHKLDFMRSKANKWLSETIERHELAEYNRNRIKIMEISDFIDAERSGFTQLKDNLVIQYELQALF